MNNSKEDFYKNNEKFKIKAEQLDVAGKNIINEANGIAQIVTTIYQIVNEMVRNNYQSVAAIAVANKIKSHHQELLNLTRKIENYGIECQRSAKIFSDTNDSIIGGIK